MEISVIDPIEMGKSIADLGFVIMAAASYLIFSAIIIFFFVKWFIRTIDEITVRYQQSIDEMLQIVKELHSMIKAIYEKL